MFTCLPPSNENEWFNLVAFVKQYNFEFGVNYQLVSFPEQDDSSSPQPEILLRDGTNKMVIERKVLAWPPDHIRHHQLWHEFVNIILARVTDSLKDDVYVLEINETDIPTSKRDTRECADQIASYILAGYEEVLPDYELAESVPIEWQFFHLPKSEREDYPIGFGLVVRSKIPVTPRYEAESRYARLHTQVSHFLDRSVLKFENYEDCLRILIIELYTNVLSLSYKDLEKVTREVNLPPQIDQIWLAELIELDDGHEAIVYHRVNSREHNLTTDV